MEIIGKWKIDEALRYTASDDGVTSEWQKAAEILADDSIDEGDKKMLRAEIIFTEDGKALWTLPVPEDFPKEELDELVASGEFSLTEDGRLIIEEKPWKEEDGRLLYDTGVKGEVFGEAVSSWEELKFVNGSMELMTFRLVKA